MRMLDVMLYVRKRGAWERDTWSHYFDEQVRHARLEMARGANAWAIALDGVVIAQSKNADVSVLKAAIAVDRFSAALEKTGWSEA